MSFFCMRLQLARVHGGLFSCFNFRYGMGSAYDLLFSCHILMSNTYFDYFSEGVQLYKRGRGGGEHVVSTVSDLGFLEIDTEK